MDRDLLRGVALLDQQWADAVVWYCGHSPRRMTRLLDALDRKDGDARRALLRLSGADLRMVLAAFTLVVAECAMRVERAVKEEDGEG